MTIKENILIYIEEFPGATDSDIENHLKKTHQYINHTCRALAADGYLLRQKNPQKGNLIGNYPIGNTTIPQQALIKKNDSKPLQEDDIKQILSDHLTKNGWNCKIAWGHQRGIDIDATKGAERWIIEVKGPGSRQPMRVNYFLCILGETLQRMDDHAARYSIAFPDLDQYRRLWEKLPRLAKDRTLIDLILIDQNGNISFLK